MKVVVRLVILVAALLLVTNMAFAGCDNKPICYDILATDEYGNTNSDSWEVCLEDDGTGWLDSANASTTYNLYLFGGGPGWFNTSGDATISGKPRYTTWIARGEYEAGFLQPIGEGGGAGDLLTGEGVHIGGSTRYTIQGKKVPCIVKQPG